MISFLIPTKSRIDLFPQAYGSLLCNLQDCPEEWEIIIVNDNSSDNDGGVGDCLKRMGVSFLWGGGNGIAAAYNTAANAASGDKLVFVNDDLFFFKPFINEMLEAYERGYSIVGAKLLYPNLTVQHAGVLFMPQNGWEAAHAYRGLPYDDPDVNKFREYPTVTYSLVLIDAKLYYDLGGISLEYGGNYEDTDFSLRALESGKKICYEPRAEVIHHEAATRGHVMETNLRTFKLYQDKWVKTGRVQKLLLEKGFINEQQQIVLERCDVPSM